MDIVYRSDLDKSEKSVLIAICHAVDRDKGNTWVAVATLVERTGLGRSTVKRVMKALEKKGWIIRRRRRYSTSITELCRERFTELTSPSTPESATAVPLQVSQGDLGGLTASPQRVQREPQSVRLSARLSVQKSSTVDDVPSLFDEFRNTYPELTSATFDWAMERIRGRMKRPANSPAFWKKSLERFFGNFASEVHDYLVDRAVALRKSAVGAGIAAELYDDAIAHGLACDHVAINAAIDAADAQLARAATLHSELTVGAFRP